MTQGVRTERPAVSARRLGYVVGGVINAALLWAVNVWPGWEAVPFLTVDTLLILWLVNACIASNIVANAVYLIIDAAWVKALGGMLTTAVGLVALVKIWQVFPFDFGDSTVDWSLVTRVVLIISVIGSTIGFIAAFVTFIKSSMMAAPE